jgi:elongation factor Ts
MKFIAKSTPVINSIVKSGAKYYSSSAVKPNIKLIAQIRQKTEISISKAKEALVATNNDLDAALEWIQTNLAEAGAKKGAKLAGRVASEGLVGVATVNDLAEGTSKGALVEVNHYIIYSVNYIVNICSSYAVKPISLAAMTTSTN